MPEYSQKPQRQEPRFSHTISSKRMGKDNNLTDNAEGPISDITRIEALTLIETVRIWCHQAQQERIFAVPSSFHSNLNQERMILELQSRGYSTILRNLCLWSLHLLHTDVISHKLFDKGYHVLRCTSALSFVGNFTRTILGLITNKRNKIHPKPTVIDSNTSRLILNEFSCLFLTFVFLLPLSDLGTHMSKHPKN